MAIEERAEPLIFSNDVPSHQKFVRTLRGQGERARACLKATGIFHLDVALLVHRTSGLEIMVVNPTSTRNFGRALMERSKTDGVENGSEFRPGRGMRLHFPSLNVLISYAPYE